MKQLRASALAFSNVARCKYSIGPPARWCDDRERHKGVTAWHEHGDWVVKGNVGDVFLFVENGASKVDTATVPRGNLVGYSGGIGAFPEVVRGQDFRHRAFRAVRLTTPCGRPTLRGNDAA
jgi:hypothetical protein